jgi:hypothetical protein
MPPDDPADDAADDASRSELDDALFSGAELEHTPGRDARPQDADEDLSHLDAELFGEPTEQGDTTDADGDVGVEPASEPSADADSTAVFGPVGPEAPAGAGAVLSRRQRRRAAPARDSGRLERLGFAALVVLMVAGVGGLAYAALGRSSEGAEKKSPQVEVRGTEVTRTTLRSPTTSPSSTTTTAPPSSTTATTEPASTTRPRTVQPTPEPDVPVVEPPPTAPPPIEPPPTTPTVPPTTAPPTTAPSTTIPEPPPVTSG